MVLLCTLSALPRTVGCIWSTIELQSPYAFPDVRGIPSNVRYSIICFEAKSLFAVQYTISVGQLVSYLERSKTHVLTRAFFVCALKVCEREAHVIFSLACQPRDIVSLVLTFLEALVGDIGILHSRMLLYLSDAVESYPIACLLEIWHVMA